MTRIDSPAHFETQSFTDAAEAVEATAGNALTPTATPASATNEEVAANASPAGSRREAVLPTADELAGLAESDPELFQELQAFLRSGNLEGLLADNPIGARQFLLSLYLQTGNPLDALDLVQRSEDLPSGSWIQVADALQGKYPDKAAFAQEHRDTILAGLPISPDEPLVNEYVVLDAIEEAWSGSRDQAIFDRLVRTDAPSTGAAAAP